MAGRRRLAKKFYTTKEVARLLGVDNWRIKNFTEGGAYGLPPAMQAGQGRGSRRLYDWQGVCRMLIADELVSCGFTPETIGKAIREIPESKLIGRGYKDSDYEVLAQKDQKWAVMSRSQAEKQSWLGSLIVIPFQQLIKDFEDEIRRNQEDEFLRENFPDVWRAQDPTRDPES